MKPLKIALFALFILVQVYLLFVKDFQVLDYPRYVNEIPQPLLDGEGKLYKVSQTFRTPGPLTRIDIMLGNYKVKPGGNPGLESIRAVLFPAETDFLYFVSKNDGTHHFSKTLREHNRAVLMYQKRRRH